MTACITQGWGRQALLISRHFPLTTSYACSRFKSSSMSADAKVVLIGADKEKKSMTFEELRKIAQQQDTRMLIKVALPSAKGDMLPAFKVRIRGSTTIQIVFDFSSQCTVPTYYM